MYVGVESARSRPLLRRSSQVIAMLFPVLCFLTGCIAALLTRSKLYAIVLPGLAFPVVSTIRVIILSRPDEMGDGFLLASPFVVAGLLMGMMYASIGALITWRIRGAPVAVSTSMAGAVPSAAARKCLSNPISVDQYCAERGFDRAQVQELINDGAVKGYVDGAGLWIENRSPKY